MQAKTARHEKTAKPSRKLTRAERKQIEAVVRQAKGDGKAHTVQDSIPFRNIFPDGLCRLDGNSFSKTIAFADVNYRLAGPEDQRDIFEHLCDFYNGYDPSIGVQMTLSSRYVEHGPEEDLFGIHPQGDDLDPIWSAWRMWRSPRTRETLKGTRYGATDPCKPVLRHRRPGPGGGGGRVRDRLPV